MINQKNINLKQTLFILRIVFIIFVMSMFVMAKANAKHSDDWLPYFGSAQVSHGDSSRTLSGTPMVAVKINFKF